MDTSKMDIRRAFGRGYTAGAIYGQLSPRMAEKALRDVGLPTTSDCIDAFCNGADDGHKGDDFRLRLP